jgi:hypothetical protein
MKRERFLNARASFNVKFFLVLCVAFLVCMHLSVCFGAAVQTQTNGADANMRVVGKSAIDGIFESYRIFDRNSFMDCVAQRFIPDRNAFINGVAQNFTKSVLIEFNYFLDTAIKEEGFLDVGFHWEKKTQPYGSSTLVLIKGKTDFVFSYEGDKWLLYQVRGDNPF